MQRACNVFRALYDMKPFERTVEERLFDSYAIAGTSVSYSYPAVK
jgi:hypothetical protein